MSDPFKDIRRASILRHKDDILLSLSIQRRFRDFNYSGKTAWGNCPTCGRFTRQLANRKRARGHTYQDKRSYMLSCPDCYDMDNAHWDTWVAIYYQDIL